MAITPDAETNFFLGLSDFWTKYFLDTKQLKTIYDAAQLLVGQQYLDLLSDVLAVSLKDTPLFSKRYFHYLPIREDLVTFKEGPALADDRWELIPSEKLARANVIMNRVLAPTSILEEGKDYDLKDFSLKFKANPFDVFDSPLPGFALRTLQVLYDAAFVTESINWKEAGVQAGDLLRIYPTSKKPQEFLIRLVGEKLGLEFANNTTLIDLRASGYRYSVLRTPFDQKKNAEELGQTSVYHFEDGDVCAVVPGTWQIKKASVGSGFFDLELAGKYIWVSDTNTPANQGLYRIRRVLDNLTLEVDKPTPFETTTELFSFLVYDYKYTPDTAPAKPLLRLSHDHIVAGSFVLRAIRAVDLDSTRLAGSSVVEGVDYLVDYEMGVVTCLTPFDPDVLVSADYSWLLSITEGGAPRATPWKPGTLYPENTPVRTPYGTYVLANDRHFSGSAYATDQGHWREYVNPLAEAVVLDTRELGAWIPDAEVDEGRLYNNFGFLLGINKPSSENYRALLEGLSQLFLLGPTFDYVESALNSMSGFPLIREDGEVLVSVNDGVVFNGVAGKIEDVQFGYNGELSLDGTFTVSNGNFHQDDVLNSSIRINRSQYNDYDFVVSSRTSDSEVVLSPAPYADEDNTGFYWTHPHANARKRFTASEYTFSLADVGCYISITSANFQRNIGVYRISDYVNEHTVVLESEHEFYDEECLTWQFTRTNEQQVVTTARTYRLPFGIPLREFDTGYVFNALESLSAVFTVVDYVVDPTWWYGQTIPESLLELKSNDAGRRHATATLIPHVINPLDNARIGDPGLLVGADDEGRAALVRSSALRWLGTNVVYFPQPQVTSQDVGQYLYLNDSGASVWLPNHTYAVGDRVTYSAVQYVCKIATSASSFDVSKWDVYPIEKFVGAFRIAAVGFDGNSATLEDFPTASMLTETPGASGIVLRAEDVELPPNLYRRTVGFVIMDRFLKYHTMKVKISSYAALDADFISTIASTLRDARPSYTYLFVNPLAEFNESLVLSDTFSVEVIDV